MSPLIVLVLGLSALASAHYEGYPFKHKHNGKYGADHPYANYGLGDNSYHGHYIDGYHSGFNYHDQPYNSYGFYPAYYYGLTGYNHGAHAYNHGAYELGHTIEYQPYPELLTHYDEHQFYYLGAYAGNCDAAHDHGVYIADEPNSFVVCDFGRVQRFQCPKGTVNYGHDFFEHGHSYNFNQLCGVNTLGTK